MSPMKKPQMRDTPSGTPLHRVTERKAKRYSPYRAALSDGSNKADGAVSASGAFPMRINKYLAHKGYATRKGADALIESKKVQINGRLAQLGDKVEESDEVAVRPNKKPTTYTYLAYNKPRGLSTHASLKSEEDIMSSVKNQELVKGQNLFPVGRLDKDSHGLIILTNDGRITDRLLSPEHDHEKEYRVRVQENLRPSFAMHLSAGVDIGDYKTKPCKVDIEGERVFRITLGEGKRHQIRRMVVSLHNDVIDLTRIRIMNIRLSNLAEGGVRKIDGHELDTFLTSLGLLSEKKSASKSA